MTYFGKLTNYSNGYMWDKTKITGSILIAKPYKSYLPVAYYTTTTQSDETAAYKKKAGTVRYNPTDFSASYVSLRTILSTDFATASASVQLYNLSSGSYVYIGDTNLSMSTIATTPTVFNTNNLLLTTNFQRTASNVYELQLYTSDKTKTAILGAATFVTRQPQENMYGAALESSIPSWMTVLRNECTYSYQVGPAVNGTQFLATGSSANTPRFTWVSGANYLLIEPLRRNQTTAARLLHKDASGVPANWTINGAGGSSGVDWTITLSGSPYNLGNEGYMTLISASTNSAPGFYQTAPTALTASKSTWSMWVSAASKQPAEVKTSFYTYSPGGYPTVADDAQGVNGHDWYRMVYSSPSNASQYIFMEGYDQPKNEIKMCMVQLETGIYPTSWIPTSRSQQERHAERCIIDNLYINPIAGIISFKWSPGFNSGLNMRDDCYLFQWDQAATSRVCYSSASSKISIINNNVSGATSDVLSFTQYSNFFNIKVEYGHYGTILTINGSSSIGTTPWVPLTTISATLGAGSATGLQASCFSNLYLSG